MCDRASALVALIVSWALFPSVAPCQSSNAQIERSFRAGQAAMQQRQFARAVDEFKKVLQVDPSLLEAEVNLGLAYQGLFDYDSATRYLAKALHDRPTLLGPNVIVGMDYVKLGSPEKGIPYLLTALKLDPSNRDARDALASSYLGQDNFQGAAEQFRQLAGLNSDKSEAWFRLGHEYLDLSGRLAYRGAHLYPDSAWGHRFLGDLVYQRSNWQHALDEYQKALNSEPQQPGLHVAMGDAYLHAGKFERAETEFRSELQSDPRSESAWLGLSGLELARNRAAVALADVEKVWEITPEFLAVQREFPPTELSRESNEPLIAVIRDTSEGAPKHFLLAALFAAASDTGQADREWKVFLDKSLRQEQGTNSLGDRNPCKDHAYSRCIDSLERQKHLTNSGWLELGKARHSLRRYQSAVEALSQIRGPSPESAEASYWLERSYQALGAETYAQLEDSFPDSWRTHQLRAEDYALRGSVKEAVSEFQAALALRPDEPELHEALGGLYLDGNNFEAAQRELERTLTADPLRTHALYLLGRVFVEEKDNEKAVPYLEQALRIQPELAEANSLLGTAYLRLGQFESAISKLEKAAPSDHYGNVHYQLFVAYRKLGRPERAQHELLLSQRLRRSNLEREQALIVGPPQSETEPQ